MKSGTIFDNFLITDDEKLAEEIGNETWGATKVGGEGPKPWELPGTPHSRGGRGVRPQELPGTPVELGPP